MENIYDIIITDQILLILPYFLKGVLARKAIFTCMKLSSICRNTVLPIEKFMTSGGQTESCQMTVRVSIGDGSLFYPLRYVIL